jgi:aspartate dehydrogenase
MAMASPADKILSVAVGGLGAIGFPVARRLAQGMLVFRLAAAAARDAATAETRLAAAGIAVPVVPLAELAELADIVVECLPAPQFRAIAESAIAGGRIFVPLSAGALLQHIDLIERARASGARIVVPTGALLGLDAVRAAAEGEIHSVTMTTRKPPRGLAGAPYLVERGISLERLAGPLKVFEGNARDGARGFPDNVNVAAALALAGIGPDRTRLAIWADPTLERNTHLIEVEADSARFSMTIQNIPSAENPRTGRLTPLSVIACLRGLAGTFRVGS